ncbi:fused MFS/spermidine synthase [Rhodopirellula sp. JC740]|uniref:Fused MFS/spermidine synthase n=1 Tax=Rhodopirellula halodulae TaxID=2894198 RepID=A0ABS8NQ64_9BACT|nr:fused MFS/spermidine synthase [Rhodopirellula sp. JC740]MCC9644606.1 fused MFS/spermidine synthase [Rhodopirellula sp. JC740]
MGSPSSDVSGSVSTQTLANQKATSWFVFAGATLLGAFLVFQVQPVISKCVLPWFGGTPAVWTTCLLFFQVLLFGGYLYAHCLRRFFSPTLQGIIHLSLLCAAAWSLPIAPSDAWKPIGTEDPTFTLLWLLTAHVALPYFVLSSTGPLVQAWLSYENQSDSVYRLYALSNVGSLVALLSYPFVVEPLLSVEQQSIVWSLAFYGFVIIDGWLAISLLGRRRRKPNSSDLKSVEASVASGQSVPMTDGMVWIGLPALASVMLLVVTSHVCQDIAVMPFLWVLPLSLYLLSFIVSFDSPAWYRPKLIAAATGLAFVAIQVKGWFPGGWQMPVEALAYLVVLFGVCLLCHGETAARKPSTHRLTLYYAMISAGGAIGGIVVALICPMVFQDYRELPLAMALSIGVVAVTFLASRSWLTTQCDWRMSKGIMGLIVGIIGLTAVVTTLTSRKDTIDQRRNFFGVLRVENDADRIQLVHGNTIHGIQLHGELSRTPTSYFGYSSGVGRLIKAMQSEQPQMRIGVIGLGCGVLAAYGREGDSMDMYEINPDVLAIAEEHFTFLKDCPAEVQHHIGDGRLLLERQTEKRFDLLILDAFSSDAIPAHLLTLEAMQLYRQRLAKDGVLAIHVSNNHLDLVPLTHRLSQSIGFESRLIQNDHRDQVYTRPSRWVIASDRGDGFWEADTLSVAQVPDQESLRDAPLWTDQHHNLASVLIWPSL